MAAIGRPGADATTGGWRSPRLVQAAIRSLEAEQRSWFLWLPVLLGTGIALYFSLGSEPPLLAAILPAALALLLHLRLRRTGLWGLATAALLACSLGFALAKLRADAVSAPVLQERIGPVEVRGHLELVEPRPDKGQRLTIRTTSIETLVPDQVPARVRIRAAAENPALKPGDAVVIRATLSPPPLPSLPGDYDFAFAAWFNGLGAVGYAAGGAAISARDDGEGTPAGLRVRAAVERVRLAIGQRITAALPGETGAIANALITGERGGISDATNQAFRDSGLFHILSISGLHMVIMAGAVFALIRMTLAAIPAIALRFPIKKWAAGGAMAGALAYLMISGAAFATVRSYLMISIMLLAVLLDRPAVALRNVALAALIVLVIWPESLFDPGFQMSFAAVVALVSVYEWLRVRREARAGAGRGGLQGNLAGQGLLFLAGIVTSTLVAGLAVAPFGIYHFHNTQQFAILANLLAIPICNLLVLPAGLAALIAMPAGLEAGPLHLMGLGIEAMAWCARMVARLPGAVGRVPAIPAGAFALMVAGGLWCTLWSLRWRLLGVAPLLAGLALAPTARQPDILVGRGGEVVAVRQEDGTLSALARRGSMFELSRWLEHDGDTRKPEEAAKGAAFRCDAQGCVAPLRGIVVAVPATAAALRDDCVMADVLVARVPLPRGCAPRVAIDPARLKRLGAHVIYRDGQRLRVRTVADGRGIRPWSAVNTTIGEGAGTAELERALP